jgi:glycosyltransferase involved in cell wall biosynthesis
MTKKLNLAIISPQKSAYSETFIKAQKELLDFNVFYYYDGSKPHMLEGYGSVLQGNYVERGLFAVKNKLSKEKQLRHDFKIKESFIKNKIQVCLAHYGPTGDSMYKICNDLNIPLIVHFHGFDATTYEVLERYENYKELFKNATRIIAVSRAMEQHLLSIGCPKNKLVYNTYGPNEQFIDLAPSLESNTLLGIGTFTDKKAPYYTILSFGLLLREIPDAKLILAGKGSLMGTCKNLVRYLKMEHAVSFPGVLTPEEFRKEILSARAFVQHSIRAESGDCEGTPVAILEASGSGLPVISTKHAGIPDVIMNGETGILVEEHDVEGMAAAMKKLLTDKSIAREMGIAGKKNIKNNFSMKRHIEALTRIINEVSGFKE